MEIFDHAVVGGGLSGTSVVMELLRRSERPLRIAVLEENAHRLFRGRAYSVDRPELVLNVPAHHMSVFADVPDHFVRWLDLHGEPYGPDDFVPRALFGTYLEDTFRSVLNEHPEHAVRFFMVSVDSLTRAQEGYVLRGGDREVRCRRLWLATGHFLPSDLSSVDEIRLNPQYVANPWSGLGLKCIPADASVFFVGTGLTLVDQIVALEALGHRGRRWALSRRGKYPLQHEPTPAYPSALEWLPEDRSLASLFGAVRRETARAAERGIPWTSVVNSLRDVTPALWQGLTDEEKRRFMRHVRPHWEMHRHRVPSSSLEVLNRLEREGQLQRLSGRLLEIRSEGERFKVVYRERGSVEIQEIDADWLVNCTGPQNMGRKLDVPWLESAVKEGVLSIDTLGLGVVPGPQAGDALELIGPPRKGTDWESTALREIRQQVVERVGRSS